MHVDVFWVLAAAVASIHCAIILLDLAGALAVWSGNLSIGRLPGWQKSYLVVNFLKSVCYLTLPACPLTSLENYMRSRSDFRSPYPESFVGHYFPCISVNVDLAITTVLMFSGCTAILMTLYYEFASSSDARTERQRGFVLGPTRFRGFIFSRNLGVPGAGQTVLENYVFT